MIQGFTDADGNVQQVQGVGYTYDSVKHSFAEGDSVNNNTASGNYSHAEGYGTVASVPAQHVEGSYNTIDSNGEYLHIIGNGTGENERSNAYAIKPDGTICVWDNQGIVELTPSKLRQLLSTLPFELEFVDLGLPSGTLWANANLGAGSVTDYGKYYAWGEITGYSASQIGVDRQFSYGEHENRDQTTDLTLAQDAAFAVNSEYRMPTADEFYELKSNTEVSYVYNYEGSGVSGYRFDGQNGKHIFIPDSKYYEFGTVHLGTYLYAKDYSGNNAGYGKGLYLYENTKGTSVWSIPGNRGCAIRPVKNS